MSARARLLLGLVALAGAGCDQLPWSGKPQRLSTEAAAPASVLPARPMVPASELVAKVNGAGLSRKDMELALQEARANVEASGGTWKALAVQNDPDQYDLPDLLDDLIIVELRAQDAVARGLDRSPEAQRQLYYLARTFFAQEWLRWQMDRIKPTEQEIAKFYEDNRAGFRDPDRIRIRQLILDSEDKAKAALVKLLEGMDMGDLAQQMSSQPDAARGPLTEKWVMRSVEKEAFAPEDEAIRALVDPALEQAAFAIDKEGGLSQIVRGPDGKFHIFQLIKRQPGREQSLLEVSDGIREHLRLKQLGDFTEELRAKAAIEKVSERLEQVEQGGP